MTKPTLALAPQFRSATNDGIRVGGLSFSVRDRRGVPVDVLSDVDVEVGRREFVSIVGPSGSGKSTLLNFIAGLQAIQSGQIEVFGASPGTGAAVGYMFQQHGLLPWRSIIANVELGLEIQGAGKKERRERALAMLSEMGLRGFEDHYPAELSGGMRQRAALARTLISDPDVILMDEPFGALDAQTKIYMQELFARFWNDHRKTVLFVTHDLNEAIVLSDRVLLMSSRPGRIVGDYAVELPRPRDFDRMRTDARANELYQRIWNDLRRESSLSMRGR